MSIATKDKEKVREYKRLYHQTHREQRRKYLEAHRAHRRERQKKYDEAHKEQKRERWKKYSETHREQRREYGKKRYRDHIEQERARRKKNYHAHLEQSRETQRNFARLHSLGTTKINGKRTVIHGLNKRPYTNYCELCGVLKARKLGYHHWDNVKPELGIWICCRCHNIAEATDRNIVQNIIARYLKLKETLENEDVRLSLSVPERHGLPSQA